jgi:hypothetical protein
MDACKTGLVDDRSDDAYCAASRHNGTMPDLSDPAQLSGWGTIAFMPSYFPVPATFSRVTLPSERLDLPLLEHRLFLFAVAVKAAA